jgi:hypothetical protein
MARTHQGAIEIASAHPAYTLTTPGEEQRRVQKSEKVRQVIRCP